MDDESESLFYLGVGPMAAILLGVALVPLRGLTTASNFTFAFLALTIAVAEFGGRRAAVGTALSSALSLDFFLTEPYLRLAIADKHDVIAFVGLTACGLIAAALGAQRGERIATLTRVRKYKDLMHSVLSEWDAEAPVEPQLEKVLRATRDAFPLSAVVVRDERNTVVASSASRDGLRPVPDAVLGLDTLLPVGISGRDLRRRTLPLPIEGGRIPLVAGNRRLGWLDLWGNGGYASVESRRGLIDVARLIALLLAGGGRGVRSRD